MEERPRIDDLPVPPERLDGVPTRAELADEDSVRGLARDELGLHVTLYVPLPERPGFDEVRGFRKVYERAAERAGERMAEMGVDPAKAARAAERLHEVPARLSELPRAARALAVFLDRRRLRAYALTHRVAPSVHVGRTFALRPLLADRQEQRGFRVLALSSRDVRLYEGDEHALRRVEPRQVPRSLEEALGTEVTDPNLQNHPSPADARPGFHGQGGARRERERDRERFHRVLASALQDVWHDRRDPLVVAADPSHAGRFLKLADLPGTLEPAIERNPESLDEEELHARALELVRDRVREERRAALGAAIGGISRGDALARPAAAARAAAQGRVARVWIASDSELHRHVDPTSGDLVPPLGDEDALDELAALVLAGGGDARVFEPEELPVSAGRPSGLPLVAELRGAGSR